jgi:hypothetical protein
VTRSSPGLVQPLGLVGIGVAAVLVPWSANALDWTEAGVHDGLWYAAAPLLLALLPSRRSGRQPALMLAGALVLAVVAIELPTVWANAMRDASGGVAGLLRHYARLHFAAFAVVALAGAGLLVHGLRAADAAAPAAGDGSPRTGG